MREIYRNVSLETSFDAKQNCFYVTSSTNGRMVASIGFDANRENPLKSGLIVRNSKGNQIEKTGFAWFVDEIAQSGFIEVNVLLEMFDNEHEQLLIKLERIGINVEITDKANTRETLYKLLDVDDADIRDKLKENVSFA